MKRLALILLLFGIAVAAYFALRPGPASETTLPIAAPALPPTPIASVSSPKERTGSARPVRSSKTVSALPVVSEQKRPEDVIPFVVEDGLAIAFGDVILGTPDQEGIQSGFYQLAPPTPWEKPEIPYAIDAQVPEPDRVLEALEHIHKKTGVQFVNYTDQPDAIVFQNGPKDCWSTLGRQGGLQPIKIAPKCTWHEITHEVLHSFGILHEQSRFDRDAFLEIDWSNIDKDYQAQFEKLPRELMGNLEMRPFDYHSIMLYDPRMFAKEQSRPTMKSKTEQPIDPSRQGLSEGDIQKVKVLFRLD